MRIVQQVSRKLLLLALFLPLFISNISSISYAASSLLSISYSSITIYNNGCASGPLVYKVSIVVKGLANAGSFSVEEHFEGIGGPRLSVTNHSDALLGTSIDLGTTANVTNWTAPNDNPRVYVEAIANGDTVSTDVIEIDCATGTYTILASSGGSAETDTALNVPPPDDRINWRSGDDSAVVYVRNDAEGNPILEIYCIDENSEGHLALLITESDVSAIATPPESNQLVAESNDCALSFYVLTSGEYQINIGPDSEGKIVALIFESLNAENLHAEWINKP
jgi:hypothetical protein